MSPIIGPEDSFRFDISHDSVTFYVAPRLAVQEDLASNSTLSPPMTPGPEFLGLFITSLLAIIAIIGYGVFWREHVNPLPPLPTLATGRQDLELGCSATACLWCGVRDKDGDHDFCAECVASAHKAGPCILHIPLHHVTFAKVSNQFRADWKHTTKVTPAVMHIYKVVDRSPSVARYDAFLGKAGNEQLKWHGTRRACLVGDDPKNLRLCGNSGCRLCRIIKTSFDVSKFGATNTWGRFGRGIYTSRVSSKADDYVQNGSQSPNKTLLLNKVAMGKVFTLQRDMPELTSAPPGYDSVVGEPGGSLNYEESVIYDNDGIRPSYLVVYEAV